MSKRIGAVAILPYGVIQNQDWDTLAHRIFRFAISSQPTEKLTNREAKKTINILAGICSWNRASTTMRQINSRKEHVIQNLDRIPMLQKGPEFNKLVKHIETADSYIGRFSALPTGLTSHIGEPRKFLELLRWASSLPSVDRSAAEELRERLGEARAFSGNSSKLSQLLHLANPDCFVVVNKRTSLAINKGLGYDLTKLDTFIDNLPLLYYWGLALVGASQKGRMRILDTVLVNRHGHLKAYFEKAWRKAIAEIQKTDGDAGNIEDPAGSGITGEEGRKLLRKHLTRERSAELVKAFKHNLKSFCCEACGFDFYKVYGELGRKFIEAHHKVPLHHGAERTTKLSDLAALCSNCHRMVHKKIPQPTVGQLKALIIRHRH